jgi:heat shock protein HtpX
MQDKQKIYLFFIGMALAISTIGGVAGYFINDASGAIYGVTAGLIISGIAAGCLYYLPAFIIVKLYSSREVTKEDSPDFMATIEEFADIVNIPVPRFYLSNKDIPLIFTVGRDCNSASIIFTDKLLDILSSEELTCVLIHEMSHIKLNQIHRQTLVAFVAGILTMFANAALWGALLTGFGQENDPAPRIIKFLAMALVAPPAASLVLLTTPASREYIADATAVGIYKEPEVYIQMLEKMGRHFSETRHEEINPAHGLLNIIDPLSRSNDVEDDFYTLFNTHPGLDERIEAIRTRTNSRSASMKLLEYATVVNEKIVDKYESITRWKKTLLYSTITHMLILFGIIVVYSFYNKDFRAMDILMITGAYVGMLVITHSMMYLIFKNKLS